MAIDLNALEALAKAGGRASCYSEEWLQYQMHTGPNVILTLIKVVRAAQEVTKTYTPSGHRIHELGEALKDIS